MTCEELLRILNDCVDGDADAAERALLEAHLAGCDPCRVVLDTLRKTVTIYRAGEVYELPGGLRERLAARLRSRWDDLRREEPK